MDTRVTRTGTIDRLLAGTCPDPDHGGVLRVTTRSVVIADSLAGMEGDVLIGLDLGRRLAVVSDPTTHAVLGERVERVLGGSRSVQKLMLPEHPQADAATVARLRDAARSADALVAVGSGTINDLCKYAAASDGKPYVVFGTAPSMNGYVSVNAAITVQGHKKSLPARAPAGVFLDLGILAGAPPRMIRSGLGDSLCRPTAQADWLLAHLLRGEPYREAPFALLVPDEEGLLGDPDALLAGDFEAMGRLARTLVLSGFGMSVCGSSHPASQGEHLISHYADMMGAHHWPRSFHGEQIGVTTLIMARLQARLLDDDQPRLIDSGSGEADVVRHFGEELGRACWQEFVAKRLAEADRGALNDRLDQCWPDIRRRIGATALPVEKLESVLKRAGAPTTAQHIHWPRAFCRSAVRHAREIRNRYTFLDFAADSGHLAPFAQCL